MGFYGIYEFSQEDREIMFSPGTSIGIHIFLYRYLEEGKMDE